MVGVIVVVIVEWLALWSFGSDVGGSDLVVVGGRGNRGCGDGGVVGVVVKGAMLVVVMVVEMWLFQSNDIKRKTYLKGSQPC